MKIQNKKRNTVKLDHIMAADRYKPNTLLLIICVRRASKKSAQVNYQIFSAHTCCGVLSLCVTFFVFVSFFRLFCYVLRCTTTNEKKNYQIWSSVRWLRIIDIYDCLVLFCHPFNKLFAYWDSVQLYRIIINAVSVTEI